MLVCLLVYIYLCGVKKEDNNYSALPHHGQAENMKNINITREKAINMITTLIQCGCYIPTASIGNGGAGFFWIYSNVSLQNLVAELKDTDNYNFRVVPESEIAEDFEHSVNLGDYDVCVEFTSTHGDNPYREQYLLWDE